MSTGTSSTGRPMQYDCTLCCFQTQEFKRYRHHILRMHKNDPNLLIACNYGACAYSTKSWKGYKMHVSRTHGDINKESIGDEQLAAEFASNEVTESDYVELDASTFLRDIGSLTDFKNAEFTLKLEAQHKISQVSIDAVVEHTSHLISHHVSEVVSNIKSHLESKLSTDDLSFLSSYQNGVRLSNVESEHSRNKYYSSQCRLVTPQGVLLGTELKKIKGHMKEVKRYGYCIPLQKSIQALLNVPEVGRCVLHPHHSDAGMMKDICDGTYIRSHPLFQTAPNALQIILNNDDMEIVNPLGTRVKKN